ncbi:MAG: hypothetical protein HYS23_00435 [Geobacter sp.]|nr:hypothetical protein [Geobacter sp.]
MEELRDVGVDRLFIRIKEERHPNLIHTAINDAFHVVEAICRKLEK